MFKCWLGSKLMFCQVTKTWGLSCHLLYLEPFEPGYQKGMDAMSAFVRVFQISDEPSTKWSTELDQLDQRIDTSNASDLQCHPIHERNILWAAFKRLRAFGLWQPCDKTTGKEERKRAGKRRARSVHGQWAWTMERSVPRRWLLCNGWPWPWMEQENGNFHYVSAFPPNHRSTKPSIYVRTYVETQIVIASSSFSASGKERNVKVRPWSETCHVLRP